jgi:peptidyl-prolyl cis-trans isomerase SurA
VAVVNGDAILMSELQEAMIIYERENKTPPPSGADLEALQRTTLDRMIDHRLQIQEAKREKIEITEDELKTALDDFVRRNGGDREKIEAQLRAQGVTWEALRRELRDQMLAQRVRSRRVSRRATVTEAEVDAYLAENRAKFEAGLKYHARHIAVLAEPPSSPAAWERAKAQVDEIEARLRAGTDFATLARERSQDASAPSGGDLGWLTRGELDPQFEGPLLKLSKGEVTMPIKSAAGYHVFALEDQEEMTPKMLADARQQVRDLLAQHKAQARYEEWLDGLRKRALIAVRL